MSESPRAGLDAAALERWLAAQGAQNDLITWVRERELGWPELWSACPRGDWMLAIALRAQAPIERVRAATLALAATMLDTIDAPELDDLAKRLSMCFAKGAIPEGFVAEAERLADGAPDLALSLAYRTIATAGRSFAEPELAAMLPGLLAELAIASVLDCAMASAAADVLRRSAEIVRAHVPASELRLGAAQ